MMYSNKERSFYLLSSKLFVSLKVLCNDISIKIDDLTYITKFLKAYNYLLITATTIDQINKFNRFLLTYVFITYNIAQRIYININTNMVIKSIVNLFSSAIWLEREIYDLFGIYFISNTGTNDLRRILTDYHFKGHPLRKDYSLIGYSERIYSNLSKTICSKTQVIF